MKKFFFSASMIAAMAVATATSAFSPKATYYYNDGTWHVFTGTPCPEGAKNQCFKPVNNVSRAIYKSPSFSDPLLYN